MQDFYLKFSDKAEAKSVLYSQADTELHPNYRNIDVLGVIYNNDAALDADGNVLTPATPLDGEDAAALEPFAVTPSSPQRVWGVNVR